MLPIRILLIHALRKELFFETDRYIVKLDKLYYKQDDSIIHTATTDARITNIDQLSRHISCLCKVVPATLKYYMEERQYPFRIGKVR
ncbi:hypothetical protein BGI33_10820 [Snodgrassella alvi]|uniref:hypothetical protein n=1 Tax=Snodgrassella alvi TaxID=1196083 RepID=UPI000C1F207A|nr:hypothetical protein [Snodgrassella alvi]PIT12564.1 hypothetical protein BGI33_10820 [Snodgrassella alvi]PIT17017.1 hypothetical protein BGI34_08285 [Snodgrassella alvi]